MAGIIFLGGCLVRTYTIEKPRVDTEIEGNQGYLAGTPPQESKKSRLGETRKINVIEIELGEHGPKPKELLEEKEIKKEEAIPQETPLEEEIEKAEVVEEIEPQEIVPSQPTYTYYTIQENDTLQKISYKFYGTTKKWELIYKENKDVLKSPDDIYPGVRIRIPVLD
jgi:nucleoid-associated protein YgaU